MTIDWGMVSVIIVSIAGSSVLAAVVTGIFTKKRVAAESESRRADAASKIEDAAGGLIDHYKGAYEELKTQMTECVLEIKDLKTRLSEYDRKQRNLLEVLDKANTSVTRLVHQLRSHNLTPVCGPEGLESE